MAKSSTIEYVTHRTIKDIYPGIDEYDTRKPIYGWTQVGGSGNVWRAFNTGLITKLYKDGQDMGLDITQGSGGAMWAANIDTSLDSAPDSDAALYNTISYSAMVIESETEITIGDVGRLSASGVDTEEYALVTAINTTDNDITVERGKYGSTPYAWNHSTAIFTDHFSLNTGEWYYSSADDELMVYSTTDPSDDRYESGETFNTLIQRLIRRASRMVESSLDSRMAREIMKDREGNYPEFIQRATGLKAIIMMLKSHDPENAVVESFEEEYDEIIEGYRSGRITLPNSITADSSKGIIREVSVNSSSDLLPVELKGSYMQSGYDLIKLQVIAGGTIGTATYSVWTKDSDQLKVDPVITADKITGDYDPVASGLYIRFQGDDDSAIVTAGDEWEIQVYGQDCETTTSQAGSISLSRRDT